MDGLELAGQWRENPEICQTQDTTLLPEIYPTQCIKNKQNISMQKQTTNKKLFLKSQSQIYERLPAVPALEMCSCYCAQ